MAERNETRQVEMKMDKELQRGAERVTGRQRIERERQRVSWRKTGKRKGKQTAAATKRKPNQKWQQQQRKIFYKNNKQTRRTITRTRTTEAEAIRAGGKAIGISGKHVLDLQYYAHFMRLIV